MIASWSTDAVLAPASLKLILLPEAAGCPTSSQTSSVDGRLAGPLEVENDGVLARRIEQA